MMNSSFWVNDKSELSGCKGQSLLSQCKNIKGIYFFPLLLIMISKTLLFPLVYLWCSQVFLTPYQKANAVCIGSLISQISAGFPGTPVTEDLFLPLLYFRMQTFQGSHAAVMSKWLPLLCFPIHSNWEIPYGSSLVSVTAEQQIIFCSLRAVMVVYIHSYGMHSWYGSSGPYSFSRLLWSFLV